MKRYNINKNIKHTAVNCWLTCASISFICPFALLPLLILSRVQRISVKSRVSLCLPILPILHRIHRLVPGPSHYKRMYCFLDPNTKAYQVCADIYKAQTDPSSTAPIVSKSFCCLICPFIHLVFFCATCRKFCRSDDFFDHFSSNDLF